MAIPIQAYPSKFFYKHSNVHPVDNSLIGGGCVITDASISNSVLFDHIKIDAFSKVDHCVVLPQVKIGKKLRVEKLYYRPRMRNS